MVYVECMLRYCLFQCVADIMNVLCDTRKLRPVKYGNKTNLNLNLSFNVEIISMPINYNFYVSIGYD